MISFTIPPPDFTSTMTVVGIFCVYNNRILYLLKYDHKHEWGKWTDPSWKVEAGEEPKQAMLRELFEETGISLDDVEFVKTYYERYPDMDFIYHKYRCVLQQEPTIVLSPGEHKAYKRFTAQEALQQSLILGEDEIIKDIYWISSKT